MLFISHVEYKTSYIRSRSIRSVSVELDGKVYNLDLEDGYQPVLPWNVTKKPKNSQESGGEGEVDDAKDMEEYSGTGSILENTAPNLIKVTHR